METGRVNSNKFTQILLNDGIYLFKGKDISPLDTEHIIYQINPRMALVVDKDSNHRIMPNEM